LNDRQPVRAWVERFVNVSIAVSFLILVGIFLKIYVIYPEPKRLELGEKVSLANVAFQKDQKSLVIFVHSKCGFCRENRDFYNEIGGLAPEIKKFIVFPEKDLGRDEFLEPIDIKNFGVVEANYASAGIRATPTIALVGPEGLVEHMWRGLLLPRAINGFKETLGISVKDVYLSKKDLPRLVSESSSRVTVVDVRDREFFAQRHYDGAQNIPVDELDLRSINEISLDDRVVVYGAADDDAQLARSVLLRNGFREVLIMHDFFDVVLVTSDEEL